MLAKSRRIAILGGSFDPPTISHLQIAAEVINQVNMDEVWIIPCGARPDKKHISMPQKRLEMTKKAVADFFPSTFPIKVDGVEVENGPSIPTFYLLEQLQEKYKNDEFHFVMGTDLIPSLHWWDEGPRLISETKYIIFERAGYDQDEIKKHENYPKNSPIVISAASCLAGPISSTEIRRRIKAGLGITGLVTSSVEEFVKTEQLYIEKKEE